MTWLYSCEVSCRSQRCPAARERIAAGWSDGVSPAPGMKCADYRGCKWPECACASPKNPAPQSGQNGYEVELTAEEMERFVAHMENPPPPTPMMIRAARQHAALVKAKNEGRLTIDNVQQILKDAG